MENEELSNMLKDLDREYRSMVLLEAINLYIRAAFRGLFLRDGRFEPIRMLMIYGAVFPVALWIYQPSAYSLHCDLLGAWGLALMGTIGVYRLSPI